MPCLQEPVVAGTGGRRMTDPTWLFTGASTAAGETGVLLRSRYDAPPEAIPVRREVVLGREDTCDVVLANPLVSRRHARVWPSAGRYGVEDLQSSNGTYVNGQRITAPVELRDGDRLTLGDAELRFRLIADDVVPSLPMQQSGPVPRAYQGPTQPVPPDQQPTAAAAKGESEGSGVGAKPLTLAVLESLVGTGFSQAIGTGKLGTFALAALTPLLATAFTLRKDGKVRTGAVVVVTAIAVALTVAGVTAADFTLGRSVFPWSNSGSTFVPIPDEGTPTAPKVTMPKLVGFDNVSAMQLLSRAGFDPANVLMLRAPSSQANFGKVVKTDPPAGRVVPNNAIVKVYLGSGGTGG